MEQTLEEQLFAAFAATGTTTTLQSVSDITATRYDPAHRPIDTVDAATSTAAAANSDTYLAVAATHPSNIRSRKVYDPDGHVIGVYQPTAFTSSVTNPNAEYMTRVDYDHNGRPAVRWAPVYDNAAAAPIGTANQAACPASGPIWPPVNVSRTSTL